MRNDKLEKSLDKAEKQLLDCNRKLNMIYKFADDPTQVRKYCLQLKEMLK